MTATVRHVVAAHHEAGHAVAAVVLDQQLGDVVIGATAAECYTESAFDMPQRGPDGFSPDDTSYIELEIVNLLAGPIAEQRHTGKAIAPIDKLTRMMIPGEDYFKARECREALGAACNLDELEQQAQDLVESHWSAIESVAALLVAEGRLTRDQVAAAVSR